jgi:putative RecB family exonuclease
MGRRSAATRIARTQGAGTVGQVTSTTRTAHPISSEQMLERLPERYSPSGMSQFTKCPLSFYFKYILKLPTANTVATTKGSLCHLVLEDLFDLPADDRTADAAKAMLAGAWERMLDEDPDYLEVIGGADEVPGLITACEQLLDNYFTIETPSGFEPTGRELEVEAVIGKVTYRGIIDRLDEIVVAGETQSVISDYKSGKKPKAAYEDDAFFAMRVYALLLREMHGTVPSALRLIYISQRTKAEGLLRRRIDDRVLSMTEKRITAITDGARACATRGRFDAKQTVLCNWCDFRTVCPAKNPELAGVPLEAEVQILDGAPAAA